MAMHSTRSTFIKGISQSAPTNLGHNTTGYCLLRWQQVWV